VIFQLTQVHPLMFFEPWLPTWSNPQHKPVLFLLFNEIRPFLDAVLKVSTIQKYSNWHQESTVGLPSKYVVHGTDWDTGKIIKVLT